jgi:hypothetical protein
MSRRLGHLDVVSDTTRAQGLAQRCEGTAATGGGIGDQQRRSESAPVRSGWLGAARDVVILEARKTDAAAGPLASTRPGRPGAPSK